MTCEEAIRAAAEAWGEGPLPPGLEEHLRSCASCSRTRREIDGLLDDLSGAPVPDPGAAYWSTFEDRVLRRIDRVVALPRETPARSPAARGPWHRLALPAAALLILTLGALLFLWQRGGGSAPPRGDLADLTSMEARLEAVMEDAAASGLGEAESLDGLALFHTGSSTVDLEENPLEDGSTVEEAGDLAALFAGEPITAWPEWGEVDRMLDDLTDRQAEALIQELDPESTNPSPAGA